MAPGVLGVPLSHVERLIGLVAASGKLIAAGIAEFNPNHDRDGMTARVAARLVARIVRGVSGARSKAAKERTMRSDASRSMTLPVSDSGF